jgi:hypothetical protein
MTIVSYHSTLIRDVASSLEAVDTTSSQIFLSRGVAGAEKEPESSPQDTFPPTLVSIFESDDRHIMTIGEPACSSLMGLDRNACFPDPHGEGSGFLALCSRVVPIVIFLGSVRDVKITPTKAVKAEDSEGRNSPGDQPSAPTTSTKRQALECSSITGLELTAKLEGNASLEEYDRGSGVDQGKGSGKDVERGRTLERGPRFSNPLSRAESRIRHNDAAIEINVLPIEKRINRSSTFYEDPTETSAVLEDNLLEPCPHVPICSNVSEVLNTPSNTRVPTGALSINCNSPFDISRRPTIDQPAIAMKTVFSDCRPLYPAPTFPPETLSQFMPDIPHLEYLAIKSSSHLWSPQIPPRTVPKSPSIASRLPTEVIQRVYRYLNPPDFNSARHSCRSWLISSLERSVLEMMLSRGGWSTSVEYNMEVNHETCTRNNVNDEWLMSKNIARECALGPDWLGNGLLPIVEDSSEISKQSAFVQTSTIDFTEIGVQYTGLNSAGTIFTVSSCGKFLMAANGCLIYIYELNRSHKSMDNGSLAQPGSLHPITSIICPRRVLACSMDTSSHRHAIAVLLDGRMGLVCDITSSHLASRSDSLNIPGNSISIRDDNNIYRGTSFLDRVSLNSSASNLRSPRPLTQPPFVFPGIATTGTYSPTEEAAWEDIFRSDIPESIRSVGPSSRNPSLPRAHPLSPESRVQSILPPQQKSDPDRGPIPIETGPHSLYRNLCSDDDPPRSVAICPQRRCVAFGCSSGIELHWVDALTGQDLNRWFPLTSPSDFLFFLPPRKSIDSAKKLRLISSAARPSERAAISERAYGTRMRSSPFWEGLGWGAVRIEGEDVIMDHGALERFRGNNRTRVFGSRMDCSDHYRAVPLSDGYHIIFTDPATGLLCLGSDAPAGGPTKLLRKIWFHGPEGQGVPVTYTGGSDLTWGVRVVAAFGTGTEQSVWFFSVPGDVFAASQGPFMSSGGSSLFRPSLSRESKNADWMDWWPDDGMQEWLNHANDPVAGILARGVWPVKIRGQEIGTCAGLVDLAIDSGPHMTVWAFSKEGIAKVWQIDDGKPRGLKQRFVVRDGTVRETDGDGDIEMIDTPSPSPDILEPPLHPQQESFDGTASFCTSAIFTARSSRRHNIEWSQHAVEYDSEGDVLMEDLPGTFDSNGSFEHVAFANHGGGASYHTSRLSHARLSRRSYRNYLVEELTGITRVDIEIR